MGHSMIDPNDWTHDRPCDQNDKRAVLWCFICVSGPPSPPSLPKAPSPLLHLYFPHQPGGQQTASTEKYIRQSFTKIWTMRPVKGKDRDSICASLTWNKYTPENSARIKSFQHFILVWKHVAKFKGINSWISPMKTWKMWSGKCLSFDDELVALGNTGVRGWGEPFVWWATSLPRSRRPLQGLTSDHIQFVFWLRKRGLMECFWCGNIFLLVRHQTAWICF